jgi:hypothetical protein
VLCFPHVTTEILRVSACVRLRNECDTEGFGSLDRDAFAQGMTRIDEELRRAQVLGRAGAGASSGASSRTPRRAPSRPILR